MPLGKRRRRILKIIGFFFAGVLLLFVSLPVWFPWVFRPVARGQRLQYATYHRAGYNRFVLQRVSFTNEDIKVTAERVESLLPNAWLWRCLVEKSRGADPFVRVDHWQVQTMPSSRPSGPSRPAQEQVRDVLEVFETLRRWLPVATLSNGIVRVADTSKELDSVGLGRLEVSGARWNKGDFVVHVNLPQTTNVVSHTNVSRIPPAVALRPSQALREATIRANFTKPQAAEIHLESDSMHLSTSLLLDARALTLQSTTWWRSNRIDLATEFASKGTLPVKASLQATNFQFPAELLELSSYRQITGSVSATWDHGRLGADVSANAEPRSLETNVPPIAIQFHARGDTNSATIETAFVSAPWLKATLSRELEVFFNGPLLRHPAHANISLDLARQPWIQLQGSLNGEAEFNPASGKYPDASFHLSGSQVGERQPSPGTSTNTSSTPASPRITARTLALDGALHWPLLDLEHATASFDDGSSVQARGKADLENSVLAESHFQFTGPLLRRWLPAGYDYESASASGTLQGPFTNIAYSGHLEATNLSASTFKASRLEADCRGRGENLDNAHIAVSAGGSVLDLRGSFEMHAPGTLPHPAQRDGSEQSRAREQAANGSLKSTNDQAADLALPHGRGSVQEIAVHLESLSLLTNGAPALKLARPCAVSISANASNQWHLGVAPFEWSGKAGDIHAQASLDWPRQGSVTLACSNISSSLFADFCKTNLPAIELVKLNGDGGWTNGPLKVDLDLALRGDGGLAPRGAVERRADGSVRAPILSAALKLRADQNGLVLSNLNITSQTSSVAVAHGLLPLSFYPGAFTNRVRLDLEKPLRFAATTEPHAFFWGALADWTGLTLREPDLKLAVSGTWAAPQGEIDLRAQQIHLPKSMTNLPTVEQVVVLVRLDRQLARLSEGRMLVQGQPVRFEAEIPLGESFWRGLREKKLPNWDRAKAHIAMEKAQIAAFQPLFPKALAPEGTLNLSMSLQPGGKMEGNLDIANARTRPLGVAGSIRNIDVKMNFVERSLVLQNASATMGGAPLQLTGQADLRGTEWMQGIVPPFHFTLRGTNVPLARQPGSIIRSDLNLTVAKTNDKPAVISGVAHLRDSFYLSDLSALVPGGVAAPSQRPPYFSIEDPPLSDWRLAVRVEGPHFLKVRSSLFNGQVSALLNLQGTLKDPIALGDAKIDSGVVRFPFASLEVQQGLVTLSSQDPYHPLLSVRASSKQYGYDVRMEVSGPADAPILQFSSTPPLASEQILLMVTAGELPKGEYTLTAQQKAQTVAMFIGRDLLAKLGYGDQAEQRLTIRSGEEISVQGKPTYHVEYKLADRWFLEGEYDRFGDFNAGFKWRAFSK